jgi:hypothetical protein
VPLKVNEMQPQLRGIKNVTSSRIVTPERFYPGVHPNISPGFPLKACGNDGLGEGAVSTARNSTHLDSIIKKP